MTPLSEIEHNCSVFGNHVDAKNRKIKAQRMMNLTSQIFDRARRLNLLLAGLLLCFEFNLRQLLQSSWILKQMAKTIR